MASLIFDLKKTVASSILNIFGSVSKVEPVLLYHTNYSQCPVCVIILLYLYRGSSGTLMLNKT